ncbi:MAG: TonB-dependent receptor [Bradyrhizobium sp.]|nr:TonB-dependent receptor [Bradyrhizobium sp.]
MTTRFVFRLALMASAALGPSSAWALAPPDADALGQDSLPAAGSSAPTSVAAADTNSGDIVVTAQRRRERLQDIPLSVAAVSSETLARANIQSVEQIGLLVPGVNITQEVPPFGVQTFVRGIGNLVGLESSVGLYTDGVYTPIPLSALLRLNDVERIEVLEGPQGTLFGRNATGGVIQIITRSPSTKPTFKASLGYDSFRTVDAEAYLSGPLASGVQASLAVTYKDQGKGWGHNLLLNNEDIYYDRYFASRGKLNFDLDDNTSLRLGAYYLNAYSATASSTGGGFPGATVGGTLATKPPVIYQNPENFYDGRTFLPPFRDTHAYGFDAHFEHEFSFARLISITSFQSMHETSYYGGVDPDSFAINSNPHSQTKSEELQLQSIGTHALTWQGGLYLLDFYANNRTNIFSTTLAGNGTQQQGDTRVRSVAGYFQGTYTFPSRTSITVGGRYTHDYLVANGKVNATVYTNDPRRPTVLSVVEAADRIGRASFNRFTWRVAVDQKIGDHMIYASVSTGYKAGFFNNLGGFPTGVTAPLEPETNINYEIGAKTSWLGGRVIFNVAAFWNELKNVQVSAATLNATTGTSTVIVANAASARVRGLEIGGSARVTSGLTANFSAQFLDPKYLDFPAAPATAPLAFLETRTGPNGQPTLYVPGCSIPASGIRPGNGGNTNNCPADVSGKMLVLASKLTATFGLNYEVEIGRGRLNLSGDVAYNQGYYWDAPNFFKQPAFTLVNGSIRYTFPRLSGVKTSLQFWMRNITGAKYYSFVRFNPGAQGTLSRPAEPRVYGAKFAMEF